VRDEGDPLKPQINVAASTHLSGGVAFAGDQGRFDNLKIGYAERDQDGSVNAVGNSGVLDRSCPANAGVSLGDAACESTPGPVKDDKTEVYLYDGQRIIEVRNGSGMIVSRRVGGLGLQTWGTDDTGIDSFME